MDKKELIKKYWFVGVLAIFLLVFIGAYGVDAYKNRTIYIQSKQEDGKYIAYKFNDENVTADDLYQSLFDSSTSGVKTGLQASYQQFQRAVLDAGYETTDEMNETAAYNAYYVIQQYGEDLVKSDLLKLGYKNGASDLTNYYIQGFKYDEMIKDYYLENSKEYLDNLIAETKPHALYHILIKVEDVNNPTEEEKAKLDEVLKALETKAFTTVAYEYSEDSSASQYGYLGVCDTSFDPDVEDGSSTKYDKAFYDVAMALEEDEVSDVVMSQYGYHIIWCTATTAESLLESSDFLDTLENENPLASLKATMAKADELGFVIKSQELADFLNETLESEAE